MITVPSHKRHKIPFKQSKTIYIFTSGQVIVTVQIHGRKKILKGLKCNCVLSDDRGCENLCENLCEKQWTYALTRGIFFVCFNKSLFETLHKLSQLYKKLKIMRRQIIICSKFYWNSNLKCKTGNNITCTKLGLRYQKFALGVRQ